MDNAKSNMFRANSNAHQNQDIDKTPPDANEPLVKQRADQAAAEAVRSGVEDQSVNLGATVETDHMAAGQPPTAGDPDAKQEQAKVVGEEAIGGTTPTPDQNVVDDVADAVGIKTQPEHPVRVTREMHRRDEHRYELDPESKGPAASA